jgi:enterochelin esterase family protein
MRSSLNALLATAGEPSGLGAGPFDRVRDQAGVHNVFVELPDTAHESQTWRKSLYDFAPRLFR